MKFLKEWLSKIAKFITGGTMKTVSTALVYSLMFVFIPIQWVIGCVALAWEAASGVIDTVVDTFN